MKNAKFNLCCAENNAVVETLGRVNSKLQLSKYHLITNAQLVKLISNMIVLHQKEDGAERGKKNETNSSNKHHVCCSRSQVTFSLFLSTKTTTR